MYGNLTFLPSVGLRPIAMFTHKKMDARTKY